ncbi:MAG: hypothetical protein RBT47_03940 [Anaerolineae bacterium]|jgi:antibiotic biosynthesis monooxygenase (ABM) superfamily enzyme|nr:hypothetical protein [Anaerolineae bacterium]
MDTQHVKFLMTWDVRPGKEESYLEFITQEFSDLLVKSNLQPTDAWYTVYGDWPEVMMAFVAEDLESLKQFLVSESWERMRKKLATYVKDYQQKAVPLKRGFQM